MEKVINYFKKQEKMRMVKQTRPEYIKNRKCCVGAHLAHLLFSRRHYRYGSLGLEKFMKKTFPDINQAHIHLMLNDCGEQNPWGADEWTHLPHEIFERISQIEALPSLSNRKFYNLNAKGSSISDQDFSYSEFIIPYFEKINLSRSNFKKSKFDEAFFIKCDFNYANFSDASIALCHFHNCKLFNVNFDGAYLKGSKLIGDEGEKEYADISGCNFKNADLSDTGLTKKYLDKKGCSYNKNTILE